MRDVDRYVDRLYASCFKKWGLQALVAKTHRYVIDLNRKVHEFDAQAVQGAENPVGTFPKGLHWSMTTQGETLIFSPMPMDVHKQLLQDHYWSFHNQLQQNGDTMKSQWGCVYHLDLHSMPSLGTSLHPDPGQQRAEVVISDYHGQSCSAWWRDHVLEAFQKVGFQVAYNWPYVGGGITQMYGAPNKNWHTLQIELNRSLYMDETTKQWLAPQAEALQKKLTLAFDKLLPVLQAAPHG